MKGSRADRSQRGHAEVFALQSHEIEDFWPQIVPFLRMVQTSEWGPIDVRVSLDSAKAQLWGISRAGEIEGIWITKIEHSLTHKWGLVWIAAGKNLDEALPLFTEHTEPWFREQGCEFVTIYGRKGWVKALPDYKSEGVILSKKLQTKTSGCVVA